MSCSNLSENSFKISLSECPICFIEIDPNNQYNYNCEHKFCKDCITMYLEEEIKNARVIDIKCPVKECITIFNDTKIRKEAAASQIQRLESLVSLILFWILKNSASSGQIFTIPSVLFNTSLIHCSFSIYSEFRSESFNSVLIYIRRY